MTKKINLNKKEKSPPVVTGSAVQLPTTTVKKATTTSGSKATKAALPVIKVNVDNQLKKDKPRKIKMIRDSFTLPESDYVKLAELKKKCLEAGVHVKKSELIRAGLRNLSKLNNASLLKAIAQVEVIKTGRPAKE